MKTRILFSLWVALSLLAFLLLTNWQPRHSYAAGFTCKQVKEIPSSECDALNALYQSTDGGHWRLNDGWLVTNTPCSWYGITCANGHITALVLPGNKLAGALPAQIGQLTQLLILDLAVYRLNDPSSYLGPNHLTTVPPEIGQLINLQELYLQGNQISSIPTTLGNLVNLHALDLNANQLTALPVEFGNLANLQYLNLSRNQLGPTSILPEFGKLNNLKVVDLSQNALEMLPAEVGNWINVQKLNLSSNRLKSLPPELGNLTLLETLDLSGNCFTAIPTQLGNLNQLQELNLSSDCLNTIPTEIGNLTELRSLLLGANRLTSVPGALGKLANLRTFFLDSNPLESVPSELGQLKHLEALTITDTPLTTLPPELGQLTSLQWLYLSFNHLTSIPPEFGNLANLEGLSLSGNQLATLPAQLGQLTKLLFLYAYDNQINKLPPELGNLSSLEVLDLNGNQLTSLPTALGHLTNLQSLTLSGSKLKSFPRELSTLPNLGVLVLDYNDTLRGPLPAYMTNLHLGLFSIYRTNWCIPNDLKVQQWLKAFYPPPEASPCLQSTTHFQLDNPGSNWLLHGRDFGSATLIPLSANGVDLLPVMTDAMGAFTVTLTTANATPGRYFLTTDADPHEAPVLTVQPITTSVGSSVALPSGIGYTAAVYLPQLMNSLPISMSDTGNLSPTLVSPTATLPSAMKAQALLTKYQWTIVQRLADYQVKIPKTFVHQVGAFPIALYWAYNNEFSKAIGLDLTPYASQTVLATIYSLKEELPEFLQPYTKARAVIMTANDKIIGAWIDKGRHYAFACSLNRKAFEEIVGRSWGNWLVTAGVVNPQDTVEQQLERLSPEQIITDYYAAHQQHPGAEAYAYITRKALTDYLFANMRDTALFNKDYAAAYAGLDLVDAPQPPQLTNMSLIGSGDDWREYSVDGLGFVILRKEVASLGWRIESIGTGP